MTKPTCKRPNCPNVVYRRGYCGKHATAYPAHRPTREECQKLIDSLLEKGYTRSGMCKASGISDSVVRHFTSGYRHTLSPDSFAKLKTLKTVKNVQPWLVPAWPIGRRVRALIAIGITPAEISEATGVSKSALSLLAHDVNETVQIGNAQAIRDYYDVASKQPAREPSTFYKNKCWAPPAAWDDIDDLDANPEGIRSTRKPTPRVGLTPRVVGQLESIINYYGSPEIAGEHLRIYSTHIRKLAKGEQETINVNTRNRIYRHYKKITQSHH